VDLSSDRLLMNVYSGFFQSLTLEQPLARRQHVACNTVYHRPRRHLKWGCGGGGSLLTFSFSKPKSGAEASVKACELFVYGDVLNIKRLFCKNVPKQRRSSVDCELHFYKLLYLNERNV
jgi:hypothetical protein